MHATKLDENTQNTIRDANEKVDRLITRAATVYGLFYEMDGKGIDYSTIMRIDDAVKVFKLYPDIIRHMENRRQDLYFSDREIKSLAYVLYSEFSYIIKQRRELNETIRTLYKYDLI